MGGSDCKLSPSGYPGLDRLPPATLGSTWPSRTCSTWFRTNATPFSPHPGSSAFHARLPPTSRCGTARCRLPTKPSEGFGSTRRAPPLQTTMLRSRESAQPGRKAPLRLLPRCWLQGPTSRVFPSGYSRCRSSRRIESFCVRKNVRASSVERICRASRESAARSMPRGLCFTALALAVCVSLGG